MIINDNILRTYMPPNPSNKPQLFENVGHESLNAIFKNSILHDYKSGRLLVQQGDAPAYLYLIIKGSLKTLRINKDGDESIIRLLKEGDTCMEAVIFMGGPSPINVQVVKDAQLLLIPSHFVKAHVIADTQFATNLITIVTRHYKSALHQIDSMSTKSPVQRVGYYLLEQHLENDHNSLEFELPFKKSVIANHLGMTPETFSRALAKIKKMGISVHGETIRMKDSFSLCHFCDSDLAHTCDSYKEKLCTICPLQQSN